jgi:hypothetical protein
MKKCKESFRFHFYFDPSDLQRGRKFSAVLNAENFNGSRIHAINENSCYTDFDFLENSDQNYSIFLFNFTRNSTKFQALAFQPLLEKF